MFVLIFSCKKKKDRRDEDAIKELSISIERQTRGQARNTKTNKTQREQTQKIKNEPISSPANA